MSKLLTLTLVIPVYNEERYLKACLDSIVNQSVLPDEVIVVDNNSTDRSVEIAKSYKFVKILHETRQHQVFAQAAGFNAAKGDIIGRIDGDSVLPQDWIVKVQEAFSDGQIIAVTGGADPYDVPLKWVAIAIFNWYTFMVRLILGHRIIWGANCAIRRLGWQKVKNGVLMRPDIWEDYDLAICLSKHGKIRYVRNLRVGVSLRSMHTSFAKHINYQFRSVRTLRIRSNLLQLLLFILLWSTTFLVYPLAAFDDWLLKLKNNS